MSTVVTVLVAVLVFGALIFIHEFGHYIFARIFHVTISDFSIGMGPKLLTYTSKKTNIRYSLSMLPIGGYVAMVGEDGTSDDPNSFDKKPAWQRFIITAAGATVNIVAGFLAMILLVACTANLGSTTVHSFLTAEEKEKYGYDISSEDSGLMAGDTVIAVGKKRVHVLDELAYEIMRQGNKPVSVTVRRNGETVTLENVVFPTEESEGQLFGTMDFRVSRLNKDFGTTLSYSWRKSVLTVRMCWESLFDLITGRYTFAAVSGPVGISSAIGSAARSGALALLNIIVLISINLGVMNLLPIPALDGGRLFTILIEMVTRKKMPPKVEGIINTIGLGLLLLLMLIVSIKDVFQIFR